eukprot:3137606-Pyramimonas_sp.AAC.1
MQAPSRGKQTPFPMVSPPLRVDCLEVEAGVRLSHCCTGQPYGIRTTCPTWGGYHPSMSSHISFMYACVCTPEAKRTSS